MTLRRGNLFSPVTPTPDEFVEVLASGSGPHRVERIVSHSHASPPGFWYDQDEWELVAVLGGSSELEFTWGKLEMFPGDWVIIPAHERHRVARTSSEPPCLWLAVFGDKEKS